MHEPLDLKQLYRRKNTDILVRVLDFNASSVSLHVVSGPDGLDDFRISHLFFIRNFSKYGKPLQERTRK